ncbi:APC family permease [Actinoplanes utahensis]|nr:APC family permease [Actinoplanes utahensis]GIF31931.1 amino acid permease [Actinoplanes utahensis]
MLASGRVGAASIAFLGLAAAAPIVTLVTVIPDVLAAGAGPLVPWTCAVAGLILLLFCAGQAAMIRRLPSSGVAYSHVTLGLGRPAGLAAAWLAIAGYQTIQFGLYALAGLTAAPLLSSFLGLTAPWWAVAAACWAVVAICGPMRIEVAAGVLGLLAVAQATVLAGIGAAGVLQPFGGRVTTDSILLAGWPALDRSAVGLLLAVAVLAFAGFESTAGYAEEGFQPRRSAGFGGYGAVLLIALLLGGVSWTMIVAAGPDRAATVADTRGAELLFDLAAGRLAPWAVTLGRFVLFAGVLAGILALHQVIARYLFALGREGALPGVLGDVRRRTAAPRAASVTQSLIAGAALAGAWAAGAGPGPRTARWLIVGGALSLLVVLLLAALATLLHLNRVPGPEGLWGRFLAPVLALVSLGAVAFLAFGDLPALLGMPAGFALVKAIPAGLAVGVLVGVGHALLVGRPSAAAPRIPRQRDPGAHRPERITQRSPGPG